MSNKPLWITIARDGDTTDGRNIPEQDLLDMASRFDPAVYMPKVYGGLEGRENGYVTVGWVCGLRTTTEDGVTWLHALIARNEDWFSIEDIATRPPVYPSLEYIPNSPHPENPKGEKALLTGVCLSNGTTIKDIEPINKYMVKP